MKHLANDSHTKSIAYILEPEIERELNEIPNLSMRLLQERTLKEQEIENQNPIESVISDIGLNEIPLGLLDSSQQISWFLRSDILKTTSRYDATVIVGMKSLLQAPEVQRLLEKLFWLVNFIKFRSNRVSVIENLRKKVSKIYGVIMTKLKSQLTEEISSLIKLILAYLVHSAHYKIFPKERKSFDVRFILDCYHIIFFEMTGVLVSDFFIHSQIEDLFQDRFFFYKQEGTLALTQANFEDGSQFVKNFRNSRSLGEMLKTTEDFSQQDKTRLMRLYQALTTKFEHIQLAKTTKTGLLMNKMESQYSQGLVELSKMPNSIQILKERENQLKLKNNLTHSKPVLRETHVESLEDENKRKFEEKTKQFLSQRLPKLKKKVPFNCSQVSPPLRNLIGSSTVGSKSKKLCLSSYQVVDFNRKDLEKLYESAYQPEKTEVRKNKSKKVKSQEDFSQIIKTMRGAHRLKNYKGVSENLKHKFLNFYKVKSVLDMSSNKHLNLDPVSVRSQLGDHERYRENLKKMKKRQESESKQMAEIEQRLRNDKIQALINEQKERERRKNNNPKNLMGKVVKAVNTINIFKGISKDKNETQRLPRLNVQVVERGKGIDRVSKSRLKKMSNNVPKDIDDLQGKITYNDNNKYYLKKFGKFLKKKDVAMRIGDIQAMIQSHQKKYK